MWKTILSAAFLFGLSSLPVVVGLAVASDDEVCRASADQTGMSAEAALKFGQDLGYTITKVHLDDGCFELLGSDRNGASVEVTLDPYSGRILPEKGSH